MTKVLADPEVADEIIGFHAQQTMEKALKAVLLVRGIPYRRTHDLAELLDLCADAGIEVPSELALVDEYTPFAVMRRYEIDDYDASTLDRVKATHLANMALRWAETLVAACEDDDPEETPGMS
ncbi:MAG: HEPN domain-containing protein [Firmicutes bacterium]|nr:HEPN domain-containing protein [Bacillota bacterium]